MTTGRFRVCDEEVVTIGLPVESHPSPSSAPCTLSFRFEGTLFVALTFEAEYPDHVATSNYVRVHMPWRMTAERRLLERPPVPPEAGLTAELQAPVPSPLALTVENLTAMGALLAVPTDADPALADGTAVEILFTSPNRRLVVPGEVRHRTQENGLVHYGVMFHRDPHPMDIALEGLVGDLLHTQSR